MLDLNVKRLSLVYIGNWALAKEEGGALNFALTVV